MGVSHSSIRAPVVVKCISTTVLLDPPGPEEAHHHVLQAANIQVTRTEGWAGGRAGGVTILVSSSEAPHFHPSHGEACQKP